MKTLVIANCQGETVKQCLEVGARGEVDRLNAITAPVEDVSPERLAAYDLVIAQDIRPNRTEFWQAVRQHPNVVSFPWLVFFGFTPDHTTLMARPGSSAVVQDNAPRIATAAHIRGLSPTQIKALYCPGFLDAMGYYTDFDLHCQTFKDMLRQYTPQADALVAKWMAKEVFFFTSNHPKSYVIEDVLWAILAQHGIATPSMRVSDFLPDPLGRLGLMPNLNHAAARNHMDRGDHVYKEGNRLLTLDQKIAHIVRIFDDAKGDLGLKDEDLERFDAAYAAYTDRTPAPLVNPYKSRPASSYWSRAVARPAAQDVRPGAHLRPVIAQQTKVATAGSCFAQHVARAMVKDGLTYYVAETAPDGMPEEIAAGQGYGLFSARYGNIYSTRQLLQLIRRAYGRFDPIETAWPTEGGYIDPFRPNIGEVFDSPQAVAAARAEHLATVRRMFESLDVFVFTLGLTEGWFDRRDGAAFPVTPGAVTKVGDPAHFGFENHDYSTVKADLVAFLGELAAVNPKAQVVLTVSPVPLIATYSDTDALTATTYSKSVLRAVAGDVARDFAAVQYFPSYEIITGSYNRGAYFGADLREIEAAGVTHVMSIFREKLVIGAEAAPLPEETVEADEKSRAQLAADIAGQMDVVCDEELLVGGD